MITPSSLASTCMSWQITLNVFYRCIAENTLDYVAREMTVPEGGFYSSQDADSKVSMASSLSGRPRRFVRCLARTRNCSSMWYGVTEHGNFEGKNILYVARDLDVLAAMHNLSVEEVETHLAASRRSYSRCGKSVKPAWDEKVLTGWNGLMLAAFAEAARVLKRDDYRSVAERNAEFILRELRGADGRLRRSWKAGDVRHIGYLEDYANLIEGLLALYQTTFDARWFVAARELADTMLEHFADPAGGFFDTSDDAEALATRPKDLQDNAVPSGNAMAATVLLKLGAFTGEGRYIDAAERALRMVQPALGSAPTGFAQWLSALDFAWGNRKRLPSSVLRLPLGPAGHWDACPKLMVMTQGMRRRSCWMSCLANTVRIKWSRLYAMARPPTSHYWQARTSLDGHATAYVCRNFVCELPVTETEALAAQLND